MGKWILNVKCFEGNSTEAKPYMIPPGGCDQMDGEIVLIMQTQKVQLHCRQIKSFLKSFVFSIFLQLKSF